MSRAPIMISELKPEQNVWKIVVRVVGIWIVKERNGQQHLEAILQDVKAYQIHVVTRSRDLESWKKILQENQTYMVYNGEALMNDMQLKVCDNKFKLFFNRSTTITALDIPDIPSHTFHFKSLTEFLNGNFKVDRLYDVISVVQQVIRTQGAGAGKKACINLTLADECGAEMELTLWEAYASQFMNYTADGQLVLILTHSWCRQSSSNGKLTLSRLANHVIEAKIISGTNIGNTIYIPRMSLSPSQSPWPFKLISHLP
ncbi:uncharacterized protein LOC131618735 [Vicia villosa]|uniref:uncharacterized protein LOC131618735 n=1 Tax=Vicia villosa TaxID=3911 RepID=UPI00273C96D4|nr:uncharacterized protein LOC131618735 [Vicia villosa]